jgi:hypothetical protein
MMAQADKYEAKKPIQLYPAGPEIKTQAGGAAVIMIIFRKQSQFGFSPLASSHLGIRDSQLSISRVCPDSPKNISSRRSVNIIPITHPTPKNGVGYTYNFPKLFLSYPEMSWTKPVCDPVLEDK